MAVAIASPGARPQQEQKNPLDDILKIAQLVASGANVYENISKVGASKDEQKAQADFRQKQLDQEELKSATELYNTLGSEEGNKVLQRLGKKNPFVDPASQPASQTPAPPPLGAPASPLNSVPDASNGAFVMPKDVRDANKQIALAGYQKNAEGQDLKYNPQTKTFDLVGRPLTAEEQRKKTNEELSILEKQKTLGKSSSTENQAALFATRMDHAEKVFSKLNSAGFDPTSVETKAGSYAPEAMKSGDIKQFEQAKRNFVNAVLRRESGAAISQSEFDSAEKQYFPQIGDTPEVLLQKAQNRADAIAAFKNEAGTAYGSLKTPTIKPPPHGNSVIQNGHTYYWNGSTGHYE